MMSQGQYFPPFFNLGEPGQMLGGDAAGAGLHTLTSNAYNGYNQYPGMGYYPQSMMSSLQTEDLRAQVSPYRYAQPNAAMTSPDAGSTSGFRESASALSASLNGDYLSRNNHQQHPMATPPPTSLSQGQPTPPTAINPAYSNPYAMTSSSEHVPYIQGHLAQHHGSGEGEYVNQRGALQGGSLDDLTNMGPSPPVPISSGSGSTVFFPWMGIVGKLLILLSYNYTTIT